MLARAAESMFWLARYIERVDALSRLMEAAQLMAGLSDQSVEWRSALIASGCEPGFLAKYDAVTPERAARFLGADPENPSSILNCLEKARINARAMRTALTRDMWDAVNGAWLEARRMGPADFRLEVLPDTLDWVRTVSTRFAGAYQTTMLRNEIYSFVKLGASLERADNTARILDVKYHVLLPSYSGVGGMLDYYQWTSILRAVSAVRAYQWIYRDEVKPWNVAELLILKPELPRSLRACYDDIIESLDGISSDHGGSRGECHRLAGALAAQLRFGRIEDIFQSGLHEHLTEMIERTADLGDAIAAFYMK
ncbi:MAG: alpha-E domain-containing protein [Alphaproteobacteria bacterium]